MSLKIDRIQLEIIINNDQARKSLRSLEDESKRLKKELKKVPEGSEEYKRITSRLKEIQQQHDKIISQLGIEKLSIRELGQRQKELNAIMRNMDPSTKAYKDLEKQLIAIKARQAELRGTTQQTGVSLSKLAQGFNKYFAIITAGLATFAGAIMAIRKAIKAYAEFDDKVADVMKTTGMAKAEVYAMNEAFKKMDTRTAQKELLDLAVVAGKLGFSARADVEGFVRAADVIGVALKEDFGGNVEETLKQIGKLVDVFRLKEKFGIEESMLKVASALNELGMASTASEGNIVEFTRRMSGIAPLAGISIENIMGLGASIDSLGLTSETSSTALSKFFISMTKDVSMFAKYANMDVKSFTDILNNDANEAFVRVLEGIRGNSNALTQLAASLGDVGADGGRMIGVLGTLANNTDKLRVQQDLANKSMLEGTSVINEFTIKNNTAQATLEKARKNLENISVELGRKLMPIMTMGTNIANYFLKGLNAILPAARDFALELSAQTDKVIILESKIRPLADRYDELQSKTELSKTEQSELNDIIKTISETIPGAVTQFDEYGQAISISTQRVREHIDLQKALLTYINRDAIVQTQKDLVDLNKEILKLSPAIEQIEKTGTFKILRDETDKLGKDVKRWGSATEEEIAKMVDNYEKLLFEKKGIEEQLSILNGNSLEKEMERREAERKAALELEAKKLEYKTKTKEELERLAAEGDQLAIEMLKQMIIVTTEAANAYDALTKKISEAQSQLANYVTLGDTVSAQAWFQILRGLMAQKYVLDQLIAAGGDMKQMLADFGKEMTKDADKIIKSIDDDIWKTISEATGELGKEAMEAVKQATELSLSGGQAYNAAHAERMAKIEDWKNASIDAASSVANALLDIVKNNNQHETDERLNALNKQKDAELNSRKLTLKQRDAIEEKYRKQEAKIREEAFRKQKTASIIQSIINTAVAVTAALPNIPLSIAAGIAGLAQTAIIAAQKVPTFAQGNMQDIIGQDGRRYRARVTNQKHKSGLFSKPTFVPGFGMFGETVDPELVFNPRDTQAIMNSPALIAAIRHTLGGVQQFAQGNAREIIRETNNNTVSQLDPKAIALLERLEKRLDEPPVAYLLANEEYMRKHNEIQEKYSGFKTK